MIVTCLPPWLKTLHCLCTEYLLCAICSATYHQLWVAGRKYTLLTTQSWLMWLLVQSGQSYSVVLLLPWLRLFFFLLTHVFIPPPARITPFQIPPFFEGQCEFSFSLTSFFLSYYLQMISSLLDMNCICRHSL